MRRGDGRSAGPTSSTSPYAKPLVGEVRLRIHDDLPAVAVRARHAANQQQIAGESRRHPDRLATAVASLVRTPQLLLVAKLQRRLRSPRARPSRSTSVRIACAVRPWRPITRPRSPGAMNNSTSVCPLCCARSPAPRSGWSASVFATTSTTSRARLTTRAVRPRRRRRCRHARHERPDRVGRLRPDLDPVLEPFAVEHELLRRGARVVVAQHLDEAAVARRARVGHHHTKVRAASSIPSDANEWLTFRSLSAFSYQPSAISLTQLPSCRS